jgi:coenzyme F420-0:L-glutamate ligase / coenzyme F420-1:gamma-L-glutamate ligase
MGFNRPGFGLQASCGKRKKKKGRVSLALSLTPIPDIPLIQPGDDLSQIIMDALSHADMSLEDGDILVLAQKIVSKSEGRLFHLDDIHASPQAEALATETGKDPRFIELVLQESNEVLRTRMGTIVVEHKLGFVCANAGIDHSNVKGSGRSGDGWFLLLPENPDESARCLRSKIYEITGRNIGILIIDSHGRAWRLGTVGVTIGLAGLPGLVDLRGVEDLFGFSLRVTMVAAADELAAAASLVMGQAAEGTPIIHVRGFPYTLREAALGELIRPKELDMFR